MEYEIHLDRHSEVSLIFDEIGLKHLFKFVKISELIKPGMNFVDIIGVVKKSYEASKVLVRSTNKEIMKKDVLLVDESGGIRLTLWGSKADLPIKDNPVLAIKCTKVNEYNGNINLSSTASSQILVNPDIDRAFELRGWYDKTGKNENVSFDKNESQRNYIREVKDNEMEYSSILGSFIYIKENQLWYDSCIGENCNKKVVLEENGKYRCEKCNQLYDSCDQRYMLSMHISDFTGQIWVNAFNDVGTNLFGWTAKEMKNINEEDSTKIQDIIKSLYFKDYTLKIRGKKDFYNNEPRIKYSAISVSPVDLLKESNRMIDILKKLVF